MNASTEPAGRRRGPRRTHGSRVLSGSRVLRRPCAGGETRPVRQGPAGLAAVRGGDASAVLVGPHVVLAGDRAGRR